jgi:hypothetical protein
MKKSIPKNDTLYPKVITFASTGRGVEWALTSMKGALH